MADFINFTCWTPEIVTATIATEAASPSDAVLLSTHTPLGVYRRTERTPISESQFMEEFLDGPAKEGVRIAPVLGESGSGKSHLVRWVRAKMAKKQGRHIIYLEKAHTSLRDVIESLLLGQTGPKFDEIRAQLAGLRDSVRQDQLERKILDELAGAVREAKVAPGDFLTKALVGDRGLYTLLHDLTFREHMLRPGSFIPKRAEHALRGRGVNDEDVPPTFTLEDLPLDIVNHANLGHANELARQMYKRLTSDPAMQSAALVLLNDNLDYAVMRAANLGVGSVQQAFMAIREQFVGEEIVLLIEDFVLIQGIRRDILDAIIEVGTIGGNERYATVRTLMAVTPGYYDSLPDTFRTRAEASSPVYEVDVRLDDDKAVGAKTVVDFVGRYLNAARLGVGKLEQATEPLNACESCPVMDECHAAFGVSRNGFGLYPYNEVAIARAVQLTADPRNPSLLNPRRVLSRMIRDVLINEAAAIRSGEFPSPDFLREDRARDAAQTVASKRLPDLPLDLREALHERYEEPELSRYLATFQFWGGASLSIKPNVLSAFSITPVDISSPGAGPERRLESSPEPAPGSVITPSLRQKLQRIDDWSKNSPLLQDEARAIRNIVRNALLADLDWTDPIMKDLSAETIRRGVPDGNQIQRVVSIEAAGENLPKGVTPIVRFDRTPGNARLFQSLLLFKETDGRTAPEALIRLRAIADAHRPEVIKRLVVAAEYENEGLVAAVASLIVGAALCGQLPANPRAKDYVAAAVWSGANFVRSDRQRHEQWAQYERAYLDDRREAVETLRGALGPSQGVAGRVHAVDDVRVRKIVQAAKEQLGKVGEYELPTWCRAAEKSRQRLEDMIPIQVAEWKSLLSNLREQVPGDSFRATVDAVVAATAVGQTEGLVKANVASVEEANSRAKGLDFGVVANVEAIVKRQEDADRVTRASLVGSADADDLVAIHRYLLDTSTWLDAGLRDAKARASTVVLDIDQEIEAALAAWDRILNPKAGDEHAD